MPTEQEFEYTGIGLAPEKPSSLPTFIEENSLALGVSRSWVHRIFHRMAFGKEARVWSFTDQAAVSLGNFLTNLLLARKLAPNEFGVYAILLGIMLFFYGAHGALVTYPLSVRGASMSKEALRSLTAFSLRITAAISLPFGAALVIASLMFESVSVGLWAAAAMTFWIIQETLRRGLMAHLRFRDASWGDTISYLGQTVLVLLLALTGWLSVKTAFCAMAITSLSAAGIQASQLGIWKRQAQEAFSWLGDYWNLGRWMLLNNFAGIFSVQFFPWALALFHGTSAAGAFQALTNVLGVTNPIVFSTVSLILPACARACKDNGVEAAWKIAKRYAIQSGLLLSPFFVATLIWPERILGLFYGHHSTYIGFTSELRMLTIAGVINYLAVVMAALFSAIEDSRTTFLVLLVSAFGSFLVGAPLVAWKGVWGAAGALLIGALLRTTISRILLHRNWHASKKEIPQCQGS